MYHFGAKRHFNQQPEQTASHNKAPTEYSYTCVIRKILLILFMYTSSSADAVRKILGTWNSCSLRRTYIRHVAVPRTSSLGSGPGNVTCRTGAQIELESTKRTGPTEQSKARREILRLPTAYSTPERLHAVRTTQAPSPESTLTWIWMIRSQQ